MSQGAWLYGLRGALWDGGGSHMDQLHEPEVYMGQGVFGIERRSRMDQVYGPGRSI